MFKFSRCPFLLIAILWAFVSMAADEGASGYGFISQVHLPNQTKGQHFGFEHPNETLPQYAIPILKNAPQGVYVSVGTERGFIGGALAEKASHLLLADVDPKVVFYNKINAVLLKLSQDRKDYLKLRFDTQPNKWLAIAEKRGLDQAASQIIQSAIKMEQESSTRVSIENYSWWKDDINGASSIEFKRSRNKWFPQRAFRGASYLASDSQYEKLHQMAKDDRIGVLQLDFTDLANLQTVANYLKSQHLPISVLDTSNVMVEIKESNGKPDYRIRDFPIYEGFRSDASNESIFLMTKLNKYPRRKTGTHFRWDYHGITFGMLNDSRNGGAADVLLSLVRSDEAIDNLIRTREELATHRSFIGILCRRILLRIK